MAGIWHVALATVAAFLTVLGMASLATVAARPRGGGGGPWLPRLSPGGMMAAVDVCAIWLLVAAICHVFYEAG